MRIDIVTLFPAMCEGPLTESIMKRAQEKGAADIQVHDLREWTVGRHRIADDAPYGGGPGMVMKIEPIHAALADLRSPEARVILLTPQGQRLNQKMVEAKARESHLILLCGHYEGIDQRVADHLVDEEISIGDYVLTNGVLPALVLTDAVVRLLPGVLGDGDSAAEDSFSTGLLDYPHYTRPEEFQGWKVPPILLSGDHARIEAWRREQALELTRQRRPDLLS